MSPLLPLLLSGLLAQTPATLSAWQSLTLADLEAIRNGLYQDHPGFAPSVGDQALVNAEQTSFRTASAMLSKVQEFHGYRAVLDAYTNGIGDEHIFSRAVLTSPSLQWPGFIVALQGSQWIASETLPDSGVVNGAVLESCDGISPERLALDRIAVFRTPWKLPAQRISNAAWLLVDDGNPFVRRPVSCSFQGGLSKTLSWRAISRRELTERQNRATGLAAPRFDVRHAADGSLWLGVGEMSTRINSLLHDLKNNPERASKAPYIVVDVRGNAGGDSNFGNELERLLFTPEAVAELDRKTSAVTQSHWRTSLSIEEDLRNTAGNEPENRGWLLELADSLRKARAAKQEFEPPLPKGSLGVTRPHPPSADPAKARVIVLTDSNCFSSCLVFVRRLRALGAAQVGWSTNISTNYLSGRFVKLPSGLSTMLYMRTFDTGDLPELAPLDPIQVFRGLLSDDPKVQAWIASLRRPAVRLE
jgi:hypothetical protein